MKSNHLLACVMAINLAGVPVSGQTPTKDYPIQPVPRSAVQLSDQFWAPRIETNRTVTIPHTLAQCEETSRIENFVAAAALGENGHSIGYPFNDSDVFKILEGASYSLSVHPDGELERYLEEVIAKISAAQEPDGYLYTARTSGMEDFADWLGDERWSNLGISHELYNAGHLYEAAVAHFQATGRRTLLHVALINADLMAREFGPEGLQHPPGHEEIELGLVKLYRATGNQEYLSLARFFLESRGRADGERELYGPYSQDHLPVAEQDEAVGHAVRAMYLYAAMADVAALTGDSGYIEALDKLWNNVVGKKLYVTGGVGATGSGEAFGEDYYLPNLNAYSETCAAIGHVFWNHRMFLLHGDAQYMDVLERTLYNAVLSGISLEGDRFFYTNPLESIHGHHRSSWFGCACCPSNIVRFLPAVGQYFYAVRRDTIYVNLFAGGEAELMLRDQAVRIKQETRYPWNGSVKLTINPGWQETFSIFIRIPGWSRNQPVPSDLYQFMERNEEIPMLKVNGELEALNLDKGYARLRRRWQKDDVIDLQLPMPVHRVRAHPSVEDNRDKVALQRGPIVYCAEWLDNKNLQVLNLMLPDEAPVKAEFRPDLWNGVAVLTGKGAGVGRDLEGNRKIVDADQNLVLIPYYAWAQRGPGEMAVWLARTVDAAQPLPAPTLAYTSSLSVSGGTDPEAITDQREAEHSNDHSVPFFHWWPEKGTLEWVQLDFDEPKTISSCRVYWFDDTGRGECRLPESWRVLYRDGQDWKPVAAQDAYGVEMDVYNSVSFDPIETDGLRLEVQLPPEFSAGIHEWVVE